MARVNKDIEPKKDKHAGGRPPRFKTPQELQDKIDEYKAYLKTTGKPPTMAGLAYYLNLNRATIYDYKEKDEFANTIKKFVDWILMEYEEMAITKGGAGVIFLMKNYGYSDKCESNVTVNLSLETQLKDMQGDEF